VSPDAPTRRRPAVELQRVARVLRAVAGAQPQVEQVERLRARRRLEHLLALGEHVADEQVGAAVVVHVGGVDAHREPARVPGRAAQRLGERAVAPVEVQEVVLLEVVGDVQVGAAVHVDVARHHAEAESVVGDEPRAGARVDEPRAAVGAAVVAQQPVVGARVARAGARARADGALAVDRVVEQVRVEVPSPS
jgi:hypothetical protein